MMAAAGGVPLSFTYNSPATSGANQNIYTFSGVGIGAAGPSRLVVIGVAANDQAAGRAVTGVTIGGVSAIEGYLSNYQASGTQVTAFYYLNVPAGTTTEVVVTTTGMENCGIASWSIYGAKNQSPAVTNVGNATSTTTLNANLAIAKPSICLSLGNIRSGTNRTFSWTGVSENFDSNIESGNATYSGASIQDETAGTTSISATSSGAVVRFSVISAAWS